MTATTTSEALAVASASMVRGVDATSTVYVLIRDCTHLLGMDSAGVLVRAGDDDLELLAATSHATTELELWQAHVNTGPCVEAVKTGRIVSVADDSELVRRWPDFGRAMIDAGLHGVHAVPMNWHGRAVGGLNLFSAASGTFDAESASTAQAFADVCTLAIVQGPNGGDDAQRMLDGLRSALQGRVLIERAKGVLGQLEGLDMPSAFDRLVHLSEESKMTLTETATVVTKRAFKRDT